MLKTGQEYLASLQDGRVIYIGDERVEDPISHPAFEKIAQTDARLYDAKATPANRELMSSDENGERYHGCA